MYIQRWNSFNENIQSGKSIIRSLNMEESSPIWKKLLDIFHRNPGYVGKFTELVFKKGWDINTVEYLYTDFIDTQVNKGIFDKVYSNIDSYQSEEEFLDDLLKLKKEKCILNIFNSFPSEQKELIKKYKKCDSLLYDLHLRTDKSNFIKKISRYHTTRDLVSALERFIKSDISNGHKKILNRVIESGCEIVKNDESENLIIVKVNYDQLSNLASHTSWCILNQGTFKSYNSSHYDQYIIYFTDITGNESMVGATIGYQLKTAHYINDEYVDSTELISKLSSRGFDIETLYKSVDDSILKAIEKDGYSILGNLIKEFGNSVFSVVKSLPYHIYNNTSDEIKQKYNLKVIDSNGFDRKTAIDLFKEGKLVDINFHIEGLWLNFGDEILPFISKKINLNHFSISLIELVQKIENVKFTDYKQIIKRTSINGDLIKFMISNNIKFDNSQILDAIKENRKSWGYDSNDYVGILSLIPSLWKDVSDYVSKLDSKDILEISKIPALKDKSEEILKLYEKNINLEMINYLYNIIPDRRYQNYGVGRRQSSEFLKSINSTSFGVDEFFNDLIWEKIKKIKIDKVMGGFSQYNSGIYFTTIMALTKADRLEDLKKINWITTTSELGKVIRCAMVRDNFKYYSDYITEPFYLNDSEEKRLLQWLQLNIEPNDISLSRIDDPVDKTLARHLAFSLVYYRFDWGFSRYINLVKNQKPIAKDKFNSNGIGLVVKKLSRPKLLEHVFNYLDYVDRDGDSQLESYKEICKKLIEMDLKPFELDDLLRFIPNKYIKDMTPLYKSVGYDIVSERRMGWDNYQTYYKIRKIN